ncbi:MAG: hypothetical protein V9E88_16440 [Ferruginibacter sp.]
MLRNLLIPALAVILFSSCYSARITYAPVPQNVPVLEEKGDTKLAAYYSTCFGGSKGLTYSKSNGLDLQSAVAISSKFAIMANYSIKTERTNSMIDITENSDSNLLAYKRNWTELGFGYFKHTGKNKSGLFQVYMGAGFGRNRFTDKRVESGVLYRQFFDARNMSFFIQPSIAHISKNGWAASFSVKALLMNFQDISTDYNTAELIKFELNELGNRSYLTIEPAITASYALKNTPALRFESQLGFCFRGNNKYPGLEKRNVNFSIGAMLNFARLSKK